MQQDTAEQKPQNRLVPSLTMAFFSTYIMDFLVSVLLISVTLTFFGLKDPVHIAITSQLATLSSVVSIVVGISIAVLSVRFSRKSILLVGAACIPIGVIGCAFAPNIYAMMLFFPFDGVGSIIVGSMVFAVAGEALPLSKRAKAIGWIVSGATWAQFVGAILIRYFFAGGNWQSYLLFYGLPVSLFAFFFVYFGVRSTPSKLDSPSKLKKTDYFERFREIFANRSATACLVGNMARHAGFAWIVFAATFYQVWFKISLADYALVAIVGTLLYALGSISGGRLVDKVGRRRVVLVTFTIIGIFVAIQTFMPYLWLALTLGLTANFLGGIGVAGSLNMTIEQVLNERGTIMSMSSVFVGIGAAIGAGVGGAVLALTGSYQAVAVTLGAFTLVAAGVYLLTKDPCKQRIP